MVKLPTLPGQKEPPKLWPPTLPETTIPTPFGKVSLPEYKVKLPKPPPFNKKSRSAMLHAIAIDGAMVPGLIPVAGDIISDIVEDLHAAELRKILSSSEYDEFLKQDKVAPATIAMVRTLTK